MKPGAISDLRTLYDIKQVLRDAGVTPRRFMICPLPMHQHRNHTPSFSIFTGRDGVQRFQCHGTCGLGGDVIDLAGYLWVPGYNPKDPAAVHRAMDMLGKRTAVHIPTPEPQPAALGMTDWMRFVPPGQDGMAFFRRRGLTGETIKFFRLGQDRDRVTIPSFKDGALQGIKKRSLLDNAKVRYTNAPGSRQCLFNLDEARRQRGPLLLVKGEIPAMLLHQWGFRAIAPTGGERGWAKEWTAELALLPAIVVGDNDDTGLRAAATRAISIDAPLKFPPPAFKDIDEYMLARPEEARKWLTNLKR